MKYYMKFDKEKLRALDLSKMKCKYCEKPMKPEPEWYLLESGEVMCLGCFEEPKMFKATTIKEVELSEVAKARFEGDEWKEQK